MIHQNLGVNIKLSSACLPYGSEDSAIKWSILLDSISCKVILFGLLGGGGGYIVCFGNHEIV